MVFLVLLFGAAASARAQDEPVLPRQMLLLPLPVSPGPEEERLPVRLGSHTMRLPDDRFAQIWRLSWWSAIGDAHRFRVAWDYVGLEGHEQFRWGGGAARLQWSSQFGAAFGRDLALDLEGNLPHGDEALHPLSARAPVIQVRLRADLLRSARWEAWLGWWGRRVSPPSAEVRQDPLSWFPSGSGADLVLRHVGARADAEIAVQRPLGGIPRSTWLHARADLPLTADFALSVGAMLAMASAENRPLDHGWTVGVAWRPAPGEDEDDSGSRF